MESRTAERPDYLPSEAWEDLARENAVVSPADANAVTKAIREAPEAVFGQLLGQVLGGALKVFGGGLL